MGQLRVGVLGAAGRMGAEVCRAVDADPDCVLVAAVDPGRPGGRVGGVDAQLTVEGSFEALVHAGAQAAVDFTNAEAAMANLRACAAAGIHAVVGTTGLTPADVDELRALFAGPAHCILAPNFAIGAVLLMRFAAMAAPFFQTAEIIELHHNAKVDAPSGTALATAAGMDEARRKSGAGSWGEDPTRTERLDGARGAATEAGLRIHAVRLAGLVAHEEVLLGTTGQSLTLRHDSYDRTSFMPGVLLALKAVADRPGLTVGLDDLVAL